MDPSKLGTVGGKDAASSWRASGSRFSGSGRERVLRLPVPVLPGSSGRGAPRGIRGDLLPVTCSKWVGCKLSNLQIQLQQSGGDPVPRVTFSEGQTSLNLETVPHPVPACHQRPQLPRVGSVQEARRWGAPCRHQEAAGCPDPGSQAGRERGCRAKTQPWKT